MPNLYLPAVNVGIMRLLRLNYGCDRSIRG